MALLLWSVPIVLIAVAAAFVRTPTDATNRPEVDLQTVASTGSLPNWNDVRVWQYGLLLAGSVVLFYVINSYVGVILEARGESVALAWLLLLFNATPLIASFTVLAVPGWIGRRRPIAISAGLAVTGLAVFAFLSGWASWLGALLTGFAASVELILLVSLPAVIAKGKAVTQLTAGMTLIGYGVAFALPMIGGWFAKNVDWLEFSLIPSLAFGIAVLFLVGKGRHYPAYN